MGIDNELISIADDLAKEFKRKIPHLEHAMEKLEKEKAAIIADLESARRGEDHASQYSVYVNDRRDRRCPRCWVGKNLTAIIKAIDGDGSVDRFRCGECKAEFVGSF